MDVLGVGSPGVTPIVVNTNSQLELGRGGERLPIRRELPSC